MVISIDFIFRARSFQAAEMVKTTGAVFVAARGALRAGADRSDDKDAPDWKIEKDFCGIGGVRTES